MRDGSNIGIQVAVVLRGQNQSSCAVVERNSIARKLFRVFVLLTCVDAVLQAKGDHGLVEDASKICTTFYDRKLSGEPSTKNFHV